MKNEIPRIILQSLAHRVQIYPFKLDEILEMSEKYKIPDADLIAFDTPTLEAYVQGLWLSGQDIPAHWVNGHYILESLGFERNEENELVWPELLENK